MMWLSHQVHDFNFSMAQSTDKFFLGVPAMGEGSFGNLDDHTKRDEGKMLLPALSLGNAETANAHPQSNHSLSNSYVGSYGGTEVAYGSHAMVQPQIAGTTLYSRVPLSIEPAVDEPIYVNAKQYHAILRRRQLRAKLEAENKLVKVQKPYLHVARHLHAMKRARGEGGRFLNTKQQLESSFGTEHIQANMSTTPNAPSSSITDSAIAIGGGSLLKLDRNLSLSTDPHYCTRGGIHGGSGISNDTQRHTPIIR